jgi:hypothetical protein
MLKSRAIDFAWIRREVQIELRKNAVLTTLILRIFTPIKQTHAIVGGKKGGLKWLS